MPVLALIGIVSATVACFGYLNHRFTRLPDAIGTTAVGLMFSLLLVVTGSYYPGMTQWAKSFANSIDFPNLVMNGLLPVLLFAGSLHVNLADLRKYKAPVLALASATVLISTVLVGLGIFGVLSLFGVTVSIWYCMAFGALISPTDPIAVLSVLKTVGVPKSLEMKISGEALFNDGTSVVAFLVLLGVATGASEPTASAVSLMLFKEVVGGLVLGGIVGYVSLLFLKGLDSYAVEILMTVAAATGGYALAQALHVSGPLAVVVTGLVIGNHGVHHLMSEKTREHLTSFWDLTDETLNLILFGLIAIKVVSMDTQGFSWFAVALFLPVVLLARFISVALPVKGLTPWLRPGPHAVKVLTWGGLRGGISVALAISLPAFEAKDMFVAGTYWVVLFSLLVQGPTLGTLLSWFGLSSAERAERNAGH